MRLVRRVATYCLFYFFLACTALPFSPDIESRLADSIEVELLLKNNLLSSSARRLNSVKLSECVIEIEYSLNRVCSSGADWKTIGYVDRVDLSEIALNDKDIWRIPSQGGASIVVLWRYGTGLREVIRQMSTSFQGSLHSIGPNDDESKLTLSKEIAGGLASAGIESRRTNLLCNGSVLVEPPLSEGFRFVFSQNTEESVDLIKSYSSGFCELSR